MAYTHIEHDRSLRLRFKFDPSGIELIDIAESRARPMPYQEVSVEEPTDFWYELRDDEDRAVYCRPERNPLLAGVEYVTGDSERPFVRDIPDDHSGRFRLQIPAIDATKLVLFGITPWDADPRPHRLGEFSIRQGQPAIAR
jgi:hypothetical protein